jgi:hypothetical protein
MPWLERNWVFLVGGVVILGIYLFRILRFRAKEVQRTPTEVVEVPGEALERTRRVREEIRRKIAERKEAPVEAGTPPLLDKAGAPVVKPKRPHLDPFGGPMRRWWQKLADLAGKKRTSVFRKGEP